MKLEKNMNRLVALCIAAFALGGCALPMPVTVASWAADGLSLIATEKTLTDHGLSALAGQDCALWRGISEGAVCRDDDGNVLMAAYATPRPLIAAPVEVAVAYPDLDGPYLKVR